MAKPMRRPNGYGTIVKRKGRRRNPYEIRITGGFETYLDKDGQLKTRQVQKMLGAFPDYQSAALELAIYNDNPYDPALLNITFEQAYQEAIKEKSKLAASTLSGYNTSFKKAAKLHKKQLVKIKQNEMQRIIDAQETTYPQQRLIALFDLLFDWAKKYGIIKGERTDKLVVTAPETEAREGIPYSVDELNKLWDNLDMLDVDIVLMQTYAGLRIMELLMLEKEDVHLDDRWIAIRGTKTDNAMRNVPIRKEIIPLLQRRMDDANNKTKYVFCNKKGTRSLPKGTFMGHFDKIKTSLGLLEEHVPHDARHTFVSRADDSGINVVALKVMVGHALDGVTAKVYTHKDIKALINEADKIVFV